MHLTTVSIYIMVLFELRFLSLFLLRNFIVEGTYF